jgi:hypothetical protein
MSVTTTVTPLINAFSVTPAGGANGQNINFRDQNPVDGLEGIQAFVPPAVPGAAFAADVTRTSLQGNEVFIQNFLSVTNGFNGSAAGWIYTAASGLANMNLKPINNTAFPYLDANPGPPPPATPEYDYQFNYTTNTTDRQVAADSDSPSSGWAANSDKGNIIDVRYKYTLYLVWKYPGGIYYPIANINWYVNFYANRNVPNIGVTNILLPRGITADAYQRSNTVPQKMAPPTFNGNVIWQ